MVQKLSKFPVFLFFIFIFALSTEADQMSEYCRNILHPTCTCGSNVINCTNVQDIPADALKQIPTHFPKLTSLHLSGNKFDYLDQSIFVTETDWNLRQLDLSNNNIVDIHEHALVNLPQLEDMNLTNNRISFRRRPYAAGHRVWKTGNFLTPIASSLRSLDLTNAFDVGERDSSSQFLQNLTNLLFKAENRFDTLQYLHLSKNSLSFLPGNAFRAMPSLQFLYLSNNRLTNFQMDSASGKELTELRLESNFIQRLDQTFMNMVEERAVLDKVYLAGNPFVCDCQSKNFIQWIKRSTKIVDKASMVCAKAFPRQFSNRSIISIDEDQLQCSDGKSAVYTAGVFALCSVAAIGLVSLLSCIVYANKRFLCRTGIRIRNWVTMANSGGYEVLEERRPVVKAEAV